VKLLRGRVGLLSFLLWEREWFRAIIVSRVEILFSLLSFFYGQDIFLETIVL
jgi:hypothetical protein